VGQKSGPVNEPVKKNIEGDAPRKPASPYRPRATLHRRVITTFLWWHAVNRASISVANDDSH